MEKAIGLIPLSNSEINFICIITILFAGVIAIRFMNENGRIVSRLLIVLGALYSLAFFFESLGRILSDNGFIPEESIIIFVKIYSTCLSFAAMIWLLYVVSRVVEDKKKFRKLSYFLCIPCAVILVEIWYISTFDAALIAEDGSIIWNNLWFYAQVYGILAHYAATFIISAICIFRFREERKKRMVATLIYSFVIIAFELIMYVTNHNYKAFGCMVAFCIFVAMRLQSISEAREKELMHFSTIMNAIKNEYISIFYVNLKKNTQELYVRNEYGSEKYEDRIKGLSYTELMNFYGNVGVYSADEEKYRMIVDPKNIMEQLKNRDMYTEHYRAVREGEIRQVEINFWRAGDEGEVSAVVMGLLDRSKDTENMTISEKKDAIIGGLVDSFEFVCYVNLANGYIEVYKASERFDKLADATADMDSVTSISELFIDIVRPEEREEFIEKTDEDFIFSELMMNGSYNIEGVFVIDGDERYYNVRFSMDTNDPEGLIIGIIDTDAQVRGEILKGEQAKEREYSIQLEATITDRTVELHEKAKSLNQIHEEIIELLGNITEARDTESGEHIRRVKGFTNILATHVMNELPEYGLTPEKIALITSASALHDIGKIMIPDAILLKPGRFTPEEYEVMKTHCEKGCKILQKAPKGWSKDYLDISMEICRHHHEKWNGKGYPDGLVGDEIPISAQIVSIADCFDALTTRRVYKDAYTSDEAYDMILNGECGAFSEKMLSVFENCKEEFVRHALNSASRFDTSNAGGVTTHSLSGVKLLLVEDNDLTRKITKDILEEEGASVYEAENGKAAISTIRKVRVENLDAILLDLTLNDMDGYELTRSIRSLQMPRADIVPIIALINVNSEEVVERAFDAGMNSYILKPVSVSSLTKLLITSMRSEQDALQKKLEETVIKANRDPLTGVKNLTAYLATIEKITKEISDNLKPVEFGVVMCDINRLKKINDTFGHDVGDVYIRNCCKLICDAFTHSPVFRIGGDEFAVILRGEDYRSRDECMDRLRDYIHLAVNLETIEDGKASIASGIAIYEKDKDENVADVTKRADEMMYINKRMMKFSGMYE